MKEDRTFHHSMVLFYIYRYVGGTLLASWLQGYEKWLNDINMETSLKENLLTMQGDETAQKEAFYQDLTFGTGGMRGILGPGTNRMNIYTVRKAVKGLAYYLEENHEQYKERGVVVAYDSRYMSREFAEEAARVLGVHGIRTYVFEALRPTPLLSFAVRYLHTVAGIMITASHNPPEYNGFKVYNDNGSQISLDETIAIVEEINKVDNELTVPVKEVAELEESELLQWIGEKVDRAYLQQLAKITKLDEEEIAKEKDLKIVYTPLHGTGLGLVADGLKQLNFEHVHVVEAQAIPDPEFTTVASPNPEEAQAFTEAIKLGNEQEADILLATDPDADRLGVAVRNAKGEYVVLTGNQLGSLLLDYILMHTDAAVLPNARMIKTIVTTELGRAIASAYGVETLDMLTGFKYIGEKINEYDTTGEQFIFGYEESYGYLIRDFARDKDAVQATVMACEMAQFWKNQGMTLLDALQGLYEKHGFYKEGLENLALQGIAGQEKIASIITNFRENIQADFNGIKTKYIEDYLVSERSYIESDQVEKMTLPAENVIKYVLEDNCWICLRPSGTEPKLKWYFGAFGQTENEVNDRLVALKEALDNIIIKPLK